MSVETETVLVSSLEEEGVDVDAFVADLNKLANEKGLTKGDIAVEEERTFPVEGATLILLTFASKVAYDIWKEFILPELKEQYRVRKQEAGK